MYFSIIPCCHQTNNPVVCGTDEQYTAALDKTGWNTKDTHVLSDGSELATDEYPLEVHDEEISPSLVGESEHAITATKTHITLSFAGDLVLQSVALHEGPQRNLLQVQGAVREPHRRLGAAASAGVKIRTEWLEEAEGESLCTILAMSFMPDFFSTQRSRIYCSGFHMQLWISLRIWLQVSHLQ